MGKRTMTVDQFAEFSAAVVRALPRDMDTVVAQGWIMNQASLANILRKVLLPPAFPSEIHAADLIPKGYTVVEDVEPISALKVDDLEFPTLGKGKSVVGTTVMRERAKARNANLGLVDGKAILAQQKKIPEDVKFIVLTGTLLRDPDRRLYIGCLDRGDGGWRLGFHWIGGGWGGFYRLARRKVKVAA